MNIQNETIKDAIFIFVDIRGFTKWSTSNQTEIRKLLEITYSNGLEVFGQRKDQSYMKRLVKFLGDGFFAVIEFDDEDESQFIQAMNESIVSACNFMNLFSKKLAESNLHEKKEINIGIGISFGSAIRFTIPGMPIDFAGKAVNMAARLCDTAESKEIVLENEFMDFYMKKSLEIPEDFRVQKVIKEPKKMGEIEVLSIKQVNTDSKQRTAQLVAENILSTLEIVTKSLK